MPDDEKSESDDDDWMNEERSPKTGRFLKGRSGNPRGRPRKPKGEALPFEVARDILEAGEIELDITEKGRTKKLPAREIIFRQLVLNAAKGDKQAMRLYMTYLDNAARTMEARAQRQYERLGAYLKSIDEGRPWRLSAEEAAFYQRLADEAGIRTTIRAFDETQDVEPLSEQELNAIIAESNVRKTHGAGDAPRVAPGDIEDIARRIIYAERRRRLSLGR